MPASTYYQRKIVSSCVLHVFRRYNTSRNYGKVRKSDSSFHSFLLTSLLATFLALSFCNGIPSVALYLLRCTKSVLYALVELCHMLKNFYTEYTSWRSLSENQVSHTCIFYLHIFYIHSMNPMCKIIRCDGLVVGSHDAISNRRARDSSFGEQGLIHCNPQDHSVLGYDKAHPGVDPTERGSPQDLLQLCWAVLFCW